MESKHMLESLDAMCTQLQRLEDVQEQLQRLHSMRGQHLDAVREQMHHLNAFPVQEMLQHLDALRAQHLAAGHAAHTDDGHAGHLDAVGPQQLDGVKALPARATSRCWTLNPCSRASPSRSTTSHTYSPASPNRSTTSPMKMSFPFSPATADLIVEDSYQEDEEENAIVEKNKAREVSQSNDMYGSKQNGA